MSQTIRRGGASARKVAAKAQSARKVEAARARTGSLMDQVMAMLPISEAQLHKIFLVLILAAAGVLLWVVAGLAGVPSLAEQRAASLATQAGFAVRRVEIHGVKKLNEQKVYERVLGQQGRQAMTRIDLEGIRQDLMTLSWVEDARISRQLPDTLIVDITERKAQAVLKQHNEDGSDSFVLIDATGHELQGISPGRIGGLLVLAGAGAEGQMAALESLLEAAPALRGQVAEAEWVGHRRWNLTFKSGQTLALPEGVEAGAKALQAFARMDGTNQLIGGRVLAFDMRTGDRMYMRMRGDVDPANPGASLATGGAPVAGAAAAGVAAAVAAKAVAIKSETPKVETPKAVEKEATKPTVKPSARPEPKSEPKTLLHKEPAKTAAKPTAKPAAKPAAKEVHKDPVKAILKAAAKPAAHKEAAHKEAAKPAHREPVKTAHKEAAKTPAKPAAKPTAKPHAKTGEKH
ncbi:cell division protein FtsQ/DivIB [Novosphingobium sp. SG707]|uniref:cell division protein FtsQ/DivIB n=1 Tax=Novosphingobium sp. SG707 TaxID=2586996 RepID=UPI0017F1A4FB|nr:cell division protein FtsQ/DivIB [Novosphingobium sp. SG707]NKI99062.1 cell division protein FtsQ [Novosphingobium sp. SG707]